MLSTSQTFKMYDRHVGVFSAEGRIYQTEYAVKSVSLAPTALAICCKDCVVFCSEVVSRDSLQIIPTQIQSIDAHVAALPVGYSGDGRVLTSFLRNEAQTHWFNFEEAASIELLAEELSVKFSEFGRSKRGEMTMGRPFGAGVLLAAKDALYYCDPAGNAVRYKAKAVGAGGVSAQEELETQYKDDLDRTEGCRLGLQVLRAVMEGGPQSLQVAVLGSGGLEILTPEQIAQFN